MTNVTVIGLGDMGSALALALTEAGKHVVGWTRSAARRAQYSDRYDVRDGVVDAIGASKVVVLCITNFETSKALLGMEGVSEALAGRTLIQLTSESPEEAEAFSQLAASRGVAVLDGAIATMPAGIGRPEGIIYYSGPKEIFDRELDVLRSITGRPVYCGARPGDASAMDMAWLSFFYSAAFGLIQGIAICKAAGLDASTYLGSTPSYLLEMDAIAKDLERQTRLDHFKGNQATNRIHLAGAEQVLAFCRKKALHSSLPQAAVDILRQTVEAGHADEEFAVAAKVIAGS